MNFTHRKKVYQATCSQWTGQNLEQITDLLHKIGYSEVEVFRDSVMARGAGRGLLCLHLGSWLRVGENGLYCVMDNESFVAKYEEIGSWDEKAERAEMNFAQRLANVRASYRCGNCSNAWKPCHTCRCSTWKANGYIRVYERSDWLKRNKLKMKQNLSFRPDLEASVFL